ncbi:glutaredoxin family protein [Sporosarcina limicola]|uniref:Glutaredoxin-like YruB-family protein n=1 Tax=Sporosarcina limicola TaxID=34101 RepID=A0A927MQ04_9BACL|nr:glutaredoxin family protein [Sporosarcina limicola]MBE1555251.1 glutaredoxin-like YruB-family protein [Sporosarcina limicola]
MKAQENRRRNKITNVATVYTSSTCPYCTMMINYLKEQNIPYKEVNVQKDQAAGQKLVEKTGQMGVPQTEINGKWVIGFDMDGIQEALKG